MFATNSSDRYIVKDLGGAMAFFDRNSGDTHFLSPAGAAIVESLAGAPAAIIELQARPAVAALGLGDEALDATLQQLVEIGLLDQLP